MRRRQLDRADILPRAQPIARRKPRTSGSPDALLRTTLAPPVASVSYTVLWLAACMDLRYSLRERPLRRAGTLHGVFDYTGRWSCDAALRTFAMRGALGGPRVLLRRLREVMAEPVSAQERLDKIVVLIAANMVAEVCSVYVLRVDGTLELYATEGLKPRSRPPDRAAPGRGPGRPGRERGQPDQPVGGADPSGLLLPAGNRRRESTTRSSACRFCGRATRSASWWCRTGRGAPIRKRKRRRCRPPPWCWRR